MANRSFTDPVTNVSVLSGPEFQQGFVQLLTQHSLPKTCLSTFLHETTHHWCFSTAVGYALAALRLRLHRRGLAIGTDRFDFWGFINDLLRYEAAMALLRPLSEGLALFCEFDVTPSDEHASWPLVTAWPLFSPQILNNRDRFKSQGYAESWVEFLSSTRMAEECIEKKASLLASPLSTAAGGYLQGYFTVKRLWMVASENLGTVVDTDKFFAFVRAFIFNDFGLILTLLNSYEDQTSLTTAVVNYIRARLFSLGEENVPHEISVHASSDTGGHWYEGKNPLGSTPTPVFNEGLKALKDLEAELLAPGADGDGNLFKIRLLHRLILHRRGLLSIGSRPVEFSVDAHGSIVIEVDGKHYEFVTHVPPPNTPETGKGYLDSFVHHSDGFNLIFSLSSEGKVIGLNSLGKLTDILLSNLRETAYQREALLQHGRELDRLVSIVTKDDDSPTKPDVLAVQNRLSREADELYNGFVLLTVPTALRATCVGTMLINGVYGLLEKSLARGTQVRELASLGIYASLISSPGASAMSLQVETTASTIMAIRKAQERYGPIVLDENERGHIQFCI